MKISLDWRMLLLLGRIGGVACCFLSVLQGCTTSRAGRDYIKDDVQFGVTEGPFRGRWWSYYERGRSFQDGGFYEEAAKDFRIAIQSRRADGLWPRTYGMHFMPEYFPHRELGVNLYLQGDIEGSIREIETSLNDQYSARAAYYFRLAQEKKLAVAAPDVTAPTLEILTEPSQSSATEVVLSGVAHDDAFVASIEVNGIPFDIRLIGPDVGFSMPVQLDPGENAVRVRVVDLAGNEHQTEVSLENDVDGPAVSFDLPVSIPGVVTGAILDPAGVASLNIGGVDADLRSEGGGSAFFKVTLAEAPESRRFVALDTLGNETSGEIPSGAGAPAGIPAVALASASQAQALEAIQAVAQLQLAASETPGPVEIHFENIPEGTSYYQDEIVVALNARSEAGIEAVTLLGKALPIVPARNEVYVTRRVPLGSGANTLEAAITDTKGNHATDARTVNRDQNELEINKNLLAIAMMPDLASPDAALCTAIIDELEGIWDKPLFSTAAATPGAESLDERFELVKRESIATIVTEQGLSEALATEGKASDRALMLGKLIPFEVLLTVQARLDNGVLEVVVDGVSSEKGVVLTGRVDVAGSEGQRDELVELLAVRLLQEFPKPQGEVIFWSYPELDAKLTKQQGTRRHRKCLVYRLDEQTRDGISLGKRPTVVAEGFITGTDVDSSSAELLKAFGDIDLKGLDLLKGYYAVLK